MKQLVIVIGLLLIPTLAFAGHDWKWSNYYEGVAGGALNTAPTCELAKKRAHDLAAVGSCTHDPYGSDHKDGIQVGQIELPCTCQCVDLVCICTDKLEIVCLSKEN